MPSAWGSSWDVSWGNSWGYVTEVIVVTKPKGGGPIRLRTVDEYAMAKKDDEEIVELILIICEVI